VTNPNTVTTPPARPQTADSDLDRLLHPAQFYDRPADVLTDHSLKPSEQRAILSSWASDACAIDSKPILRQPSFAARPATFDDVMDALMELDRMDCRTDAMANPRPTAASTAGSKDR